MSKGQVATEFEWLAGDDQTSQLLKERTNFQFIREGYLFMTEEESDHLPHGVYTSTSPTPGVGEGGAVMGGAHAVLVRRTSDPSIKGVWRRRWCVLSQTADGVHLVYYKHQQSFTNCEPPMGVVLMEGCKKLYTVPNHSKSNKVFAVAFPYRIIMFYPDKGSDLQEWLEAFQAALNMKDSTTSTPLKGLPKQKALRKDVLTQPWPRGHEMSQDLDKQKKTTKEGDSGEVAEVVSFRSLTDKNDEDKTSMTKAPPQAAELKGLPKKKALHNHHKSPEEKKLFEEIAVPDLDTEGKGAVQFLGFRMLDT